jgi:hypothetical protein
MSSATIIRQLSNGSGEMFDYTWIEDVDKGSRVWESKKAGLLMQGVRKKRTICRPALIFRKFASIKNEALHAT